MRIKILNKTYNLKFVSRLSKDNIGECTDPNEKHRIIRIKNSLKGKEKLETILHELMHVYDWRVEESFVDNFSADVTEILYKLGYRHISETDKEDIN